MKKLACLLLAILFLVPVGIMIEQPGREVVAENKGLAPKAIATHVVISEVFYDETGKDYNEFVELYNPTTASVDLGNWKLKHYDQAGTLRWTRTFASGTTIVSYGFYLIGQKDPLNSTDWGGTQISPDNLTAGPLQNGPDDYLVLEDATGTYVDGVRWGDGSELAPTIPDCESGAAGAPDVTGDSIERRPGETNPTGGNGVDTDNNYNDFLQRATPEPQNATSPTETPAEGPPPAEHVVINEVLYNPLFPEPASEWVELYNGNNTTSFCIDNWTVSDLEGTWTIPDPTTGDDYVIPAKGHVIIANDGNRFFLNHNFYPDFEKQGGTPAVDISLSGMLALKNSGDEVILNNSAGQVIDAVVWELGSYGSIVPFDAGEADGQSIQRTPEGYEGTETPDAGSPTGHDETTENMSSGVFTKGTPTPKSADVNAPTISGIAVDARSVIAVINWTTTDPGGWPENNPRSTSEVVYSVNVDPDNATMNFTASDSAYVADHEIMLTGLTPSTTYYFYVKSVDGLGHVAVDKNGGLYYSFTTAPADKNAPVLTVSPTATPTDTTATIKWTTDEDSTSVIFYGETTDLGFGSSNLLLTTSHEVTIWGLEPSTTYYYEIRSEDPSGNVMIKNNGGTYYTFTTDAFVALNYYLGNFHCHTDLSDGEGTPDEAYAYANETAQIDALMISDHSHMLDSDTAPNPNAEYNQLKSSASTYNQDGIFVAIAGQENGHLTEGFGHHNVYDADVVMRPQDKTDPNSVRIYWDKATDWIINNQTLSHFCHPGGYGTEFDDFRYIPEADPYIIGIELLNGKRTAEYEDAYINCLAQGWHVGALGSQDNHHKWWGNQADNNGRIPLTVFIASSLTKANTLEALKSLQFYAIQINNTTALEVNRSDMPIINFSVNGHKMGEEFNESGTLHFNISFYKESGNFKDAWLYEDGNTVASYYGINTNSFVWTPSVELKKGKHFYFVKVIDTEEDKVWSSPIWVNKPVMVLPDDFPAISNVEHIPASPSATDKAAVTAKVTDDKGIYRAVVWYSVNDSAYMSVTMVDDGLTNSDALPNDKIYTTKIPEQANGTSVKYYIAVIDSSGQTTLKPSSAPSYFYSYFVGPHVVINEVYSNAPGNETAEFIELYNPTGSAVSLADWTIQDEYKGWYEDKFAFPSGASIASGGFVVIARAAGDSTWGYLGNFTASGQEPDYEYGYSSKLDNPSITNLVPIDADSEIKLDNSYDALHLCNAYGVLVDQIEYGSEGVGVPGTYVANPPEGQSISRGEYSTDTDNCIVDFDLIATPTPKGLNNLPPRIWDVKHTAPKAGKNVTVTAKIYDELISTIDFYYSINGAAYISTTMTAQGNNVYAVEIPGQSNGTFVSYYIRATDQEPQTTYSPENAPEQNYTYLVGPHIVINEIYVDPPTQYDGAEFIELYNPTDTDIDITGWRLCDEPFEWGDIWEFPTGTTISAKGFIVIAKDGSDPADVPAANNDGFYQEFGFLPDFEMFDNSKNYTLPNGYEFDNTSVPNMTQITFNDYDNQIRLDNYDYGDAVYLFNQNGMVVDCVEYHTVLSRNNTKNHVPGLVATAPWESYSLTRDVLESDTDDSSQDFFLAPPTPKANASKTFYYFEKGWNLISLPFSNTTYNNAQELAKAIPGCKWVAKWNATIQDFDRYRLRSWDTGFELEPGGSYLIHIEAPTGLQIYNKALTSAQVNLVAKWNSVGPLRESTNASALASSIGSKCTAVAKWESSLGRFVTHPAGSGISDFTIERGDGCFVWVTSDTTWTNS